MKWYTERPTRSGWALVAFRRNDKLFVSMGLYNPGKDAWELDYDPDLERFEGTAWATVDLSQCSQDLMEAP